MNWSDDVDELAFLGIVVAIIAFIIPIYKYLFDRKLQSQDTRFKIYHGLIRNLVEPDFQDGPTSNNAPNMQHVEKGKKVDRLVAIVFELRNFPEYFEVTERILNGLKLQWENDPCNRPIINEMQYTLSYITTYQKGVFRFLRWTIILSPMSERLIKYQIAEEQKRSCDTQIVSHKMQQLSVKWAKIAAWAGIGSIVIGLASIAFSFFCYFCKN